MLTALLFFVLTLFILPLCLGAVHAPIYLTYQILVFTIALLMMLKSQNIRELSHSATIKNVSLLLTGLAGYASLSYLYLRYFGLSEHPVIGRATHLPDSLTTLSATIQTYSFIAVFLVTAMLLVTKPKLQRLLNPLLVAIAGSIAMIALAHWFYDNGKLFWIFAPDHVFITRRARWPFVNSNHLAHFLLPMVFVVTAFLESQISVLSRTLAETPRRFESSLWKILPRRRFIRAIFKISLTALILLALLLSIVGTLSRGSWLGLALAAVFYAILRQKVPMDFSGLLNPPANRLESRRRRSSTIDFSGTLNWLHKLISVRLIVFLLAAVLLSFFLAGQGGELLQERIEYGMTASKDDLRWELYKSSLPLLKESWPLGLGLSSWAGYFPMIATPELASLNPEYLHSDPYQFLIELGLGSLLVLALICYLSIRVFSLRPSTYDPRDLMTIACYCGLLAFLIAALFDFPFRIPALSAEVALILAYLCYLLENVNKSPKTQSD